MTLVIAVAAGLLIGLSLGALGGGGSILAVPVLIYGLGQSATQATTGSLVVVGVTSLVGAVTAYRSGKALVGRGVTFGVVAIGGAAAGASVSTAVPDAVLLAAFAALLVVVAAVMIIRGVRGRREHAGHSSMDQEKARPDEPIVTFRPEFRCRCSKALAVLLTATAVGLITGFLGVGGGFLVVPALVLVMGLPMAYAAGTSLVVITITSASALLVKTGAGIQPDWPLVVLLTVAALLASWVGVKVAGRLKGGTLQTAFSGLLVLVAGYTAWQAIPQLL